MNGFPPQVDMDLEGWRLFWARLEVTGDAAKAVLAGLRKAVEERIRATHAAGELSRHPTAAAVRGLFRRAGCDPTRYRPSSETLLRRVLRGESLPAIHPLVDLNNCLSVELVVPCCVMAEGSVAPPFTLRAGRPGESMTSLRGAFDLEGKPLLADAVGPFGTPITDSERVKVLSDTVRAWLVAYLPEGVVDERCAAGALKALIDEAPAARVVPMA